MSDIFISYARSTASQAQQVAEALKVLGYGVWRDDELPAHRAYADVIEERLQAAKAVVVIWSAEAVKSEWVRSEADRARADHKLVQLTVEACRLPMPFDQIQCADLAGWSGDTEAPGWRKVVGSIADLLGGSGVAATPAADASLPLPSKPSIAVMPFANLSGDPEQEYFADGMVEEIVDALARFQSLFVIASGSTQAFKGKAVAPTEFARQLGVRYVLEGSVRKGGHRVRISVKLIDAANGSQIWGERFEDTLEDVFDLQDKVALGVAGQIEPMVQEAEQQRVATRPTDNMGSYDLYLRSMALTTSFRIEGVAKALELLQRAVALDPGSAEAIARVAWCHAWIATSGPSDDEELHRREAAGLMARALQMAPNNATVLARGAAVLNMLGEDRARAATLIERALALNPGSANVWFISGLVQLGQGASEVAIAHFETTQRLAPLSRMSNASGFWIGVARFQQAQLNEALALISDSTHPILGRYVILAAIHGHLGHIPEAQAALATYRTLSPRPIGDTLREFAYLSDPAHRKLLLDGIALAEGKSPAATEARAE